MRTGAVWGRADLKDVDDNNIGLKGSPTKIAKASDKVRKGAGEKMVDLDAADAAGVPYTAGFVHNVMYETYLKQHDAPEDIKYFMCGPPMMTKCVCDLLDSLGVAPENILFDNFGA